jgi:hypothetical protein
MTIILFSVGIVPFLIVLETMLLMIFIGTPAGPGPLFGVSVAICTFIKKLKDWK